MNRLQIEVCRVGSNSLSSKSSYKSIYLLIVCLPEIEGVELELGDGLPQARVLLPVPGRPAAAAMRASSPRGPQLTEPPAPPSSLRSGAAAPGCPSRVPSRSRRCTPPFPTLQSGSPVAAIGRCEEREKENTPLILYKMNVATTERIEDTTCQVR
jgi:hypothetical protein